MNQTSINQASQGQDVVQRTIRAANRLAVIVGVVLIALVAVGILLGQRYLANFVAGPRPISVDEITSITDPNIVPHYWVTATGSQAIDTGWQIVGTNTTFGIQTSTSVDTSYFLLQVGDKFLLVAAPGDTKPGSQVTYTGALQPIPSDVNSQVVGDIQTQAADVAANLLPFELDASDLRLNGAPFLVIGAIVLLIGLRSLFLGLRNGLSLQSHPIWKQLGRFGEPTAMVESVNAELASPHTQIGMAHLTPHWLVDQRRYTLQAVRLTEIVWAYQLTTRRRTYGVPTGTTYTAQVFDQTGKQLRLPMKQAMVGELLGAIHSAAPWAIVGFSTEIQTMWRKQRQQLLEQIRQRRDATPAGSSIRATSAMNPTNRAF